MAETKTGYSIRTSTLATGRCRAQRMPGYNARPRLAKRLGIKTIHPARWEERPVRTPRQNRLANARGVLGVSMMWLDQWARVTDRRPR